MNKLGKFIFFIAACMALSSCTARDPSIYDVKSPCVSADIGGQAPCERRIPVENDVA